MSKGGKYFISMSGNVGKSLTATISDFIAEVLVNGSSVLSTSNSAPSYGISLATAEQRYCSFYNSGIVTLNSDDVVTIQVTKTSGNGTAFVDAPFTVTLVYID